MSLKKEIRNMTPTEKRLETHFFHLVSDLVSKNFPWEHKYTKVLFIKSY